MMDWLVSCCAVVGPFFLCTGTQNVGSFVSFRFVSFTFTSTNVVRVEFLLHYCYEFLAVQYLSGLSLGL
jgi:hypothetical protein